MISAAVIALRSDARKIPSVFSMPPVTQGLRALFDKNFLFSLFAEFSDTDYDWGIGSAQENLGFFDLIGSEGEKQAAGGLSIC